MKKDMKYVYCLKTALFSLFCCLFVSGCSSSLNKDASAENTGIVTIGHSLEVQNTDERLTLSDNKDALAADGLYYATWVLGDSVPYENSDGETVDLYDAQLYLLLGESKNNESAQTNMKTWLAAAEANYVILDDKEVTCNEQTYHIIAYNCKEGNSPYAHGVSAFSVSNSAAVCIELTCRENYEENLETILTDFLNRCSYLN